MNVNTIGNKESFQLAKNTSTGSITFFFFEIHRISESFECSSEYGAIVFNGVKRIAVIEDMFAVEGKLTLP